MMFQPYHAYLLAALGLGALGTGMGLAMLIGLLGVGGLSHLMLLVGAHAHLQVYGFVTLFTTGVALLMLPKVLNTSLKAVPLAYAGLLSMLVGLTAGCLGLAGWAALLQSLSALSYLTVVGLTFRARPRRRNRKGPLTPQQSGFLLCGGVWLLVCPVLSLRDQTMAFEGVLWGFAGLYVAGVGLRLHPAILGLGPTRTVFLWPSLLCWNLGLLLRWLDTRWWIGWLALGIGLFLLALGPFRRALRPAAGMPWLRHYVRASYLWLLLAVLLTGLTETNLPALGSAARHALATGFLLSMIAGMGLRMLLAFETRRVIWPGGPWFVLLALNLATALRVVAQAFAQAPLTALGGALQAVAVWTFVLLLLSSRPIVGAEPPPQDGS